MSVLKPTETLGLTDVQEWLESLGLSVETEEEKSIQDQLRDGILLCQLVNKIKPGSVENIKPKRSSGDAEENILRFLQACTTLGVKKIFRPADLLDEKRDFASVLVTLQQLYNIAADLGMGVIFSRCKKQLQQNGTSGSGGSSGAEEEMENGVGEGAGEHIVRAIYGFNGSNEDELQFEKGDLITVTKVVDGGWWEGICGSRVGWFPGNYVEEYAEGRGGGSAPPTDGVESEHHYHNLVVQDILDSERTYVHDLHTLLSVYLVPLKTANIVSMKDVDYLTGNLPELSKWQQSFFKSLEDCSRLPVPQQNLGAIFLKSSQEVESLNAAYCSNHPRAVAVLTENSDKLSAFMESKGAASPGMLALTSYLSKPFRRLEKYPALLKELQRHLTEGHADTDSVATAIDTYNGIATRTQDIRKKKEMEHEMLSNPVKGFSGQCLTELGECSCVIQVNQALNAEVVEERFFLVFPSSFVILGVGQSLSGYELSANYPLVAVSVKKGQHSEHWPYPVEVMYKQETIHASLCSEKDQKTLIECVGRQEGVPNRAPHRAGSVGSFKAISLAPGSRTSSGPIFRSVYPPRAMRHTSVPIQRAHHWGFKSLQPAPPLRPQQLMALRERDRSPKAAKKFIYPAAKKKRASKSLEEILSTGSGIKFPVENRPGDPAILKVIEAYCASNKGISHTQLDHPITSVMPRSRAHSSSGGTSHSMYSHSGRPGSGGTSHSMYSHSGRPGSSGTSHSMYSHSGRSHGFSSILEDRKPETKSGKSSTLPASGRYRHPPTSPSRRHDTPFYRPTSPILLTSESPTASPKGSHRKRAESDAYSYVRVKNTYI